MKARMRERRSLLIYNELIEVCTQEARRRIGWLKISIWRLKGVRGYTEQGMCPVCNKEGWSHILRCEETRSWRKELVDKRFTSIEPETGMIRTVTIKDNDKLQKVGLSLSKYKENWKRSVMKYEK
jgi:hypothetical protein